MYWSFSFSVYQIGIRAGLGIAPSWKFQDYKRAAKGCRIRLWHRCPHRLSATGAANEKSRRCWISQSVKEAVVEGLWVSSLRARERRALRKRKSRSRVRIVADRREK